MKDTQGVKTAAIASPRPREAVLRMKEYHPPLGNRTGLRMDFNENTFACSPRVLDALGRISRADLTVYPEREPLERLVAKHLSVDPAQVLLTNGVDEAIHVLCQTYLGAGDEMLLPVPAYSMYEVYGSATEARIVTVPMEKDFAFPAKGLLRAITPATKLIAIANPNSPTGQPVRREDLLQIIDAAPHAMVLIDEAYFHFFGETVLDLIGRAENVIVARTFSKAYGLAGLRLGAMIAAEDQMLWLRRVISPYSVNSLALACLRPALEDSEYLEWYVREVLASRESFVRALTALQVPFWPSAANFVLTRIGGRHAEFARAMHDHGVLVRDRSRDPGCDGCVRITLGTLDQTSQVTDVLRNVLETMQWKREEV